MGILIAASEKTAYFAQSVFIHSHVLDVVGFLAGLPFTDTYYVTIQGIQLRQATCY